jgi:Ulp1 protease family, C-terminal catalytic domain
MVDRSDYFKPERAAFLMNVVFTWMLLDAHDKGCQGRIFGHAVPNPPARLADEVRASARLDSILTLASLRGMLSGTCAIALQWLRRCGFMPHAPQQHAMPDNGRAQGRCGAESRTPATTLSHADIAASGWRGFVCEGLPKQRDDSSCGVFMTAFAQLVLTGCMPPYDFTQKDIPTVRKSIAATLLGLPSAPTLQCGGQPFGLGPVHAKRAWWWPW